METTTSPERKGTEMSNQTTITLAENADEYLDKLVKVWREYPPNHNIDAALKANATDTSADPNNLFRAGVFEGLAEAAAWGAYEWSQIDDIVAIKAAIYRAYNVAW